MSSGQERLSTISAEPTGSRPRRRRSIMFSLSGVGAEAMVNICDHREQIVQVHPLHAGRAKTASSRYGSYAASSASNARASLA